MWLACMEPAVPGCVSFSSVDYGDVSSGYYPVVSICLYQAIGQFPYLQS